MKYRRVFRYSLPVFLLWVVIMSARSQETKPIINASLVGTVIDSNTKEPLEGVTVQLEAVTHSVKTDRNGRFQFVTGQKLPFTVIVSYLGYENKKLVINTSPTVIELTPTERSLDEVVVVGYGTQRRQDLTGSIAKVNASDVNKIPIASFDAQLQGKAPGVQVLTNSGVPGEAIFLRVRGTTSINSSSDPLYIVDGVFLNNTSLQNISLAGRVTSPLADINPGDIESIEVLKDAAATAIYGSRGANGVVIITTKQGNYGAKTKIDIDASNGWVQADKSLLPPLATGPEVAELANEWTINSLIDQGRTYDYAYARRPFRPVSEVVDGVAGRGTPEETPTYDRLGLLLRKGHIQDYNLGITGGGNDSRYYLGAGYTGQQAYLKVLEFQRASLKFNFDQKLSERVKIGLTNSFSRSYRNQARTGDGPQAQLYNSAIATAVYTPIYTDEGIPSGTNNTIDLINNYDINTVSLRYVGSAFAEADLAKGLKLRSSLSLDYNIYDETEYWNTNTVLGSGDPPGLKTSGISRSGTWINEQTLAYQKKFDNHQITALVGNTLQSNTVQFNFSQGSGFANDSYKLISSAAVRTAEERWTQYTLASFFGRAGYNYADRYIVEATLRADGSSKFGANNRWGYFPAFSGAWRISQEGFLKDASWLSDLKIRASWGITGNQAGINNFAARGLWSGGATYADALGSSASGIAPNQLGNDDLRWEKTTQTNIGFDFAAFNNRLSLTADVYNKYTSDVLLEQPIPGSSGFSEYWANVGEISNRGYEVTINTSNIRNKNFSWNTALNISGNRNKIEKLPSQISFYSRDWVVAREGYSLNSFWLYEQTVDPQTGDAVFDGQLEDGTLPIEARKILGNVYPKFYGGLSNSFRFKQFDLSTDFSFQYGNKSLNLYRYFRERNPTSGGIFKNLLNRWQKPGDITDVPRLTSEGLNYTIDANSRYLEDASFLKLRQVSFGYTLPQSVLSRTGLSKARVYFVGANLFVWSKFTGDPESTVSGNPNAQGLGAFGTPPQPRSFQFGLNLTL